MTNPKHRSMTRVSALAVVVCLGLVSCTTEAQSPTEDTPAETTETNESDATPESTAATEKPTDTTGMSVPGAPNRTGTQADSDQADGTAAMFAKIDPAGAGCSVAVQQGSDLAFAAGFGSLAGSASIDVSGANIDESAMAMNVTTKFDIASTSKQFTGLAIETLIAAGEIARDDVVGDLLPASMPAAANVTVGQLLNHTSGLPDYGDLLTQEYDEAVTQKETITAIAAATLTTKPGSTFEYSNSNYVLLASIVEAVTNEPFATYVKRRVFDPLDLDMAVRPDVMADPVAAIEANIAVGAEWPVAWQQYGDGSIVTTPTELVRWGSLFWDGNLNGPALSTLGKANSVEMEDGDRYGSGLIFGALDDGTAAIYHDGSWGGTVTDWVVVPSEQLSVAVSCNAEDAIAADNPAFDIAETWRK